MESRRPSAAKLVMRTPTSTQQVLSRCWSRCRSGPYMGGLAMTWGANPNVIIPFLRLLSAQVSSEVSGVRRALAVGSDCLMLIIQQI